MSYRTYLTYENGRQSHLCFTRDRKVIRQHIESLFADADLRETAKEIVLEYKKNPLFIFSMCDVNDKTMAKIPWPKLGKKRTLKTPKIASLSMPSQMYDFLQELGGGSASKAVQDMCLEKMGDKISIDEMFYNRCDSTS
ncbi:hypothetical protein [Xenorhabdus bovienii]|uniref:hypothetical protein n=1 Tax=Xenorhabdus bovienii TaxID=40576 RepID=UPI0023B304F1|nr:hypothetical protein [Xenorhabdus bovienii]MDE9467030.1 hypothetical protein [Xenorhabdus bovienii]MDE9536750.1 hypothetical protein [Xenorhabdus bovienii]MDE9589770.1 hypothetical protein [Xenorhabdus bovienii]